MRIQRVKKIKQQKEKKATRVLQLVFRYDFCEERGYGKTNAPQQCFYHQTVSCEEKKYRTFFSCFTYKR